MYFTNVMPACIPHTHFSTYTGHCLDNGRMMILLDLCSVSCQCLSISLKQNWCLHLTLLFLAIYTLHIYNCTVFIRFSAHNFFYVFQYREFAVVVYNTKKITINNTSWICSNNPPWFAWYPMLNFFFVFWLCLLRHKVCWATSYFIFNVCVHVKRIYIFSHSSLASFYALWLLWSCSCPWGCRFAGTITLLPFIATPMIIANSSLNVKYGLMSHPQGYSYKEVAWLDWHNVYMPVLFVQSCCMAKHVLRQEKEMDYFAFFWWLSAFWWNVGWE